jgi:hypothetical protein
MRHDGARYDLRPAALLQNFVAPVRMIFEARIFFIIEIMDESDNPPEIFFRHPLEG